MSEQKQNSSSRGGRQSSGRKKKSRKKKVDPRVFWGDQDALPTPDRIQTETLEPVAVVASLGQPPIPGQQASSQHYFRLVYDRASQLGLALGHAGGLDDLRPEDVEELSEITELDSDELRNREREGNAGEIDEPLREVGSDEEVINIPEAESE